jgi:hypothetical protein
MFTSFPFHSLWLTPKEHARMTIQGTFFLDRNIQSVFELGPNANQSAGNRYRNSCTRTFTFLFRISKGRCLVQSLLSSETHDSSVKSKHSWSPAIATIHSKQKDCFCDTGIRVFYVTFAFMVYFFLQNSIRTYEHISKYGIMSFKQSLYLESFNTSVLNLKMFTPYDSRIEIVRGQHYLCFCDKNVSYNLIVFHVVVKITFSNFPMLQKLIFLSGHRPVEKTEEKCLIYCPN